MNAVPLTTEAETRTGGSIFGDQDPFLEAMGNAEKSVDNNMDGRIIYIA